MANEWGKALKKFRERAKLSQGQFCDEVSFLWMDLSDAEFEELREIVQADQLVLTNTTISRYEKGRRQPPQRRTQHLALIWALHKLQGIRTAAEANLWLQFADRAALTAAEQSTIFGTVDAVTNGVHANADTILPEQQTFIWSSSSAIRIISSTAVILGALIFVVAGASLWRNYSADPNRPSTGGGVTETPIVVETPIVTVAITSTVSTPVSIAPVSTAITQTVTAQPATVTTESLPTETPVPPTETSIPPTETSVPPTVTPIPPTAEPPQVQAGSTRRVDGIDHVYVPSGLFLMGSTEAGIATTFDFCTVYNSRTDCLAANFQEEAPQSSIETGGFWLMQTEVTNAQIRAFVEGDGYSNSDYWTSAGWQWRVENAIVAPGHWGIPEYDGANRPVVGVSWYEAVAYSRWLSQRTGLDFRLPTEAEWEKAARGPSGFIFPWGNEWNPTRVNYCDANCNQERVDQNSNDGYEFTSPVGQYKSGASPYNAYDMAGNVWEWTSTIYNQDLFPAPYKDDARESMNGTYDRIWRGGSWYNLPDFLRTAKRGGNSPEVRWSGVGFRLLFSEE